MGAKNRGAGGRNNAGKHPPPAPPPTPATPPKRWHKRLQERVGRLLRPVKIPGWLVFLWGLFTLLPDNQSRLAFWWDAAKWLGGNLAVTANVLESPIFGAALMVIGALYVAFVDDEIRPTLKNRWVSTLGWTVLSVVLTGIFSVTLIIYVVQQVGPRRIYPEQANVMKKEL